MKKRRSIITPVSLEEVYAYTGEYQAKLIIDPDVSQVIESVAVDIRNSDGETMRFTAKRWGTKISLSFVIDEKTPDGVSVVDILMRHSKTAETIRERFDFWVIK